MDNNGKRRGQINVFENVVIGMKGDVISAQGGDFDVNLGGNYIKDCSGNIVNIAPPSFQEIGLSENPPEDLIREFVSKAEGKRNILQALLDSRLVKWLEDRIHAAINSWTETKAQMFLAACLSYISSLPSS